MKSHVGTRCFFIWGRRPAGLKSIHPEGGDPGSLTLNVCRSWRWPLVRRGQMFWDVPPVWTGACAGCFSIIHHTDVTSHHLTVVFINEKAWKMNGHSWLDVISTSCCMCGQTVAFVFLSLAWRRFLFSTGLWDVFHTRSSLGWSSFLLLFHPSWNSSSGMDFLLLPRRAAIGRKTNTLKT